VKLFGAADVGQRRASGADQFGDKPGAADVRTAKSKPGKAGSPPRLPFAGERCASGTARKPSPHGHLGTELGHRCASGTPRKPSLAALARSASGHAGQLPSSVSPLASCRLNVSRETFF
jgi:hypothetical protein